jgi:hypothetical protein
LRICPPQAGGEARRQQSTSVSGELETNVLLTIERRLAPEGVDVFWTFGQRKEMVARQRTGFRGEAHVAVGEQQVSLASIE